MVEVWSREEDLINKATIFLREWNCTAKNALTLHLFYIDSVNVQQRKAEENAHPFL